IIDWPQASHVEPFLHPVRRGPNLHFLDERSDIARTEQLVLDFNVHPAPDRRASLIEFDRRIAHCTFCKRGNFSSNTKNREEVRAVWREIEVKDYFAKNCDQGLSHSNIVIENKDAVMVIGQSQLLLRTDHSGRLNATNDGGLE